MACPLLDIEQAGAVLDQGGVIAYPTEAVFGLGCRSDRNDALQRLLGIKQRTQDKGVILIGASPEQLLPLVHPDYVERLKADCQEHWPGTTLVVPACPGLDPLLTGGRDTVALRQVDHALAAALCRHCQVPLVSTSANLSGQEPLRDAEAVRGQLPDLDGVLSGDTGGRRNPSRIISWPEGRVLRP